MSETLTPLDLDAIEAAIAACRTYNFGMYQADRLAHEHAPALVAEVKRLRAAPAIVRNRQPVKPDREAVARAIFEAGAAGAAVEFGLDGPVPWSSLDADDVERMCAQADAVLDLWPGRSEAEVKAAALREAADAMDADQGVRDPLRLRSDWLRARADRLAAAEGGADRG